MGSPNPFQCSGTTHVLQFALGEIFVRTYEPLVVSVVLCFRVELYTQISSCLPGGCLSFLSMIGYLFPGQLWLVFCSGSLWYPADHQHLGLNGPGLGALGAGSVGICALPCQLIGMCALPCQLPFFLNILSCVLHHSEWDKEILLRPFLYGILKVTGLFVFVFVFLEEGFIVLPRPILNLQIQSTTHFGLLSSKQGLGAYRSVKLWTC